MKNKNRNIVTLFGISVVLVLGAVGIVGGATMIEKQVMELMRDLDTLDEPSRMTLLSSVDEQRQELLAVLLKHLGTSSSKSVQAAAIYLIGRHRLSNGAGELFRRIDFATGGEAIREPEPLWETFPAMEALITIGRPSIPGALELLAKDSNSLRRDLAVKVIRYVEDAEIAKLILERAHDGEKDPQRKAMLADGMQRLERLVRDTQ